MDRRVQAAIHIVERDLTTRFTLGQLAARVGLSPSGLRRLFILNTDLSPSAYLKRLRFEHAHHLLSQPESVKRVKEVMAAVGFTDPSHFAREFKRRYGMTPHQWQQRAAEVS
jgi:AraC-like DNA-binding protein